MGNNMKLLPLLTILLFLTIPADTFLFRANVPVEAKADVDVKAEANVDATGVDLSKKDEQTQTTGSVSGNVTQGITSTGMVAIIGSISTLILAIFGLFLRFLMRHTKGRREIALDKTIKILLRDTTLVDKTFTIQQWTNKLERDINIILGRDEK